MKDTVSYEERGENIDRVMKMTQQNNNREKSRNG